MSTLWWLKFDWISTLPSKFTRHLAISQSTFIRLEGKTLSCERFWPLSALLVLFSFCADGQMVSIITISLKIVNQLITEKLICFGRLYPNLCLPINFTFKFWTNLFVWTNQTKPRCVILCDSYNQYFLGVLPWADLVCAWITDKSILGF